MGFHSGVMNELLHRRRKVKNIGWGARFRILGEGGGQIPSRHMTS